MRKGDSPFVIMTPTSSWFCILIFSAVGIAEWAVAKDQVGKKISCAPVHLTSIFFVCCVCVRVRECMCESFVLYCFCCNTVLLARLTSALYNQPKLFFIPKQTLLSFDNWDSCVKEQVNTLSFYFPFIRKWDRSKF